MVLTSSDWPSPVVGHDRRRVAATTNPLLPARTQMATTAGCQRAEPDRRRSGRLVRPSGQIGRHISWPLPSAVLVSHARAPCPHHAAMIGIAGPDEAETALAAGALAGPRCTRLLHPCVAGTTCTRQAMSWVRPVEAVGTQWPVSDPWPYGRASWSTAARSLGLGSPRTAGGRPTGVRVQAGTSLNSLGSAGLRI
jgi:hypothetical protein